MASKALVTLAAIGMMAAAGCSSRSHEPVATVPDLDLQRFMGDWYVIAHIPTRPEREAYNAVESYRLDDQGRVQTTFTFRKGGFDGPLKEYTPTGFIHDERSNAEWRMQFIWPFKAEYLVAHVDDAYTETVIARTKRDYVWVMTRDWEIPEGRYQKLMEIVASLGYDLGEVRRVPHQWPDEDGDR
jgi:apolipoprotein D and lipocalin family protein